MTEDYLECTTLAENIWCSVCVHARAQAARACVREREREVYVNRSLKLEIWK